MDIIGSVSLHNIKKTFPEKHILIIKNLIKKDIITPSLGIIHIPSLYETCTLFGGFDTRTLYLSKKILSLLKEGLGHYLKQTPPPDKDTLKKVFNKAKKKLFVKPGWFKL